MRVYSSSTKVSHPIRFSGHFNRLPDNGKLDRELLIRRKAEGRIAAERVVFPQRRIAGRTQSPQIHTLLRDILGIRDVGAQSLGSALFDQARTCHWKELAIFHAVGKPAPQDPF
jgi:hypothetical protein